MQNKIKKRAKNILKIRNSLPENKLEQYWEKKNRYLNKKILISLVAEIDHLPSRKRVLRIFLDREKNTFTDFDNMLNQCKDILNHDDNLKKQFYEKCFSVCTENNLAELGECGDSESIKELIRRIQNGIAKKSSGFQALINLFRKSPSLEARTKLWKLIEQFDPDKEVLVELHNIVYGNREYYKILYKIQKLLRKKEREYHKNRTIIKEVQELVSQIKQE